MERLVVVLTKHAEATDADLAVGLRGAGRAAQGEGASGAGADPGTRGFLEPWAGSADRRL